MSSYKQTYVEVVLPKPSTPNTSHRRSKLIGGTVKADYINNDDGSRVIVIKLKQETEPVAKKAKPAKQLAMPRGLQKAAAADRDRQVGAVGAVGAANPVPDPDYVFEEGGEHGA